MKIPLIREVNKKQLQKEDDIFLIEYLSLVFFPSNMLIINLVSSAAACSLYARKMGVHTVFSGRVIMIRLENDKDIFS